MLRLQTFQAFLLCHTLLIPSLPGFNAIALTGTWTAWSVTLRVGGTRVVACMPAVSCFSC